MLFYSVKLVLFIGKVIMIRLVKDEMECMFMCFWYYLCDCLLFNFCRKFIGEIYVCELSNFERVLELGRM